MVLREDTEGTVFHTGGSTARQGRHSRPKPFGGRLRLPTLRFSGAAMAMSTVVGISIATTLLLNEQQGVGRRAGVARIGTSAPPPDRPDGDGSGPDTGTPHTPAGPPAHEPSATASHPVASGSPSAGPAAPTGTASPTATAATDRPTRSTPDPQPVGSGTPAPAASPSAPGPDAPHPATGTGTGAGVPSDTPAPTDPRPLVGFPPAWAAPGPEGPGTPGHGGDAPASTATGGTGPEAAAPEGSDQDGTDPDDGTWDGAGPDGTDGEGIADRALAGLATVQSVGRDGSHHRLDLTVTEPLTALQAEFRLLPGGRGPVGGSAWTDLPGAVATAHQERGSLVYRFTVPDGTDVRPGRYSFGVRGARTAPPTGPQKAAAESWNAAGFGIERPRAVAALGTFEPSAQPVPADTPTGLPGTAPTGAPGGPQAPLTAAR
ncbi:hypothetical protein ACWGB8_22750 [Kitasatospora sp. NPDC054939]